MMFTVRFFGLIILSSFSIVVLSSWNDGTDFSPQAVALCDPAFFPPAANSFASDANLQGTYVKSLNGDCAAKQGTYFSVEAILDWSPDLKGPLSYQTYISGSYAGSQCYAGWVTTTLSSGQIARQQQISTPYYCKYAVQPANWYASASAKYRRVGSTSSSTVMSTQTIAYK